MFFLDIGSTFLTAYLLILRFSGIISIAERLGLSVFFALLIKSVLVFFLVIAQVSPDAQLQTLISVVLLAALVVGFTVGAPSESEEETLPSPNDGKGFILLGIVGFLFAAAMLNAWVFPITEPDAILYHVRALVLESELDFASDQIEIQFRRYPPFVPLVYVSMIAHGVMRLPLIFPVIYLALLMVVYGRVLTLTKNASLSSIITLVLATTPYFWWHSVQPVLNLSAGAWYALGIFYWFSAMDCLSSDQGEVGRKSKLWLVLSGVCLSGAAWTRPEFLLYALIPMALMVWRLAAGQNEILSGSVRVLSLSILVLPTLWGLVLFSFWSELPTSSLGWIGLLAIFWLCAFVVGTGTLTISQSGIGLLLLFIATVFFSTLFVGNKTSLTPLGAMGMGLFRTFGFQVFFAYTSALGLFLLISKFTNLTSAQKDLARFLCVYLVVHWMVYTWWPLKSTTVVQFFDTPFISPGNAVNSPDTREMIAFYPVLLLWVAQLRKVRHAFEAA